MPCYLFKGNELSLPLFVISTNMTEISKDQIIRAALILIEDKGWNGFTLMDVARGCDIGLAALLEWFADKTDILVAYGRQLDLRTLSEADKPDMDLPAKDRLFDLLMGRFDVLNDDRGAVLNILKDIKCDPVSALVMFPHLPGSMKNMLEGAGINSSGLKGTLSVYALAFCYLNTVRIWVNDDSVDLSKTMAALDKNLGYFDRLA